MARLARIVAAGVPHHVTQRGNRRQRVFFNDGDDAVCKALLAEGCRAARVACWAWCLMPNHVHLILVPRDGDGLRAALGEAHRPAARRRAVCDHAGEAARSAAQKAEAETPAARR